MKYILIYFLIFISSFSLELNEKNFNLDIAKGEIKSKEYILTNNSEIEKEYYLSATDKNVKIQPKGFRLKPFDSKKFQIIVSGEDIVGPHDYYLEIKEVIRKKPEKNEIYLNKLFRIKQSYKIIK